MGALQHAGTWRKLLPFLQISGKKLSVDEGMHPQMAKTGRYAVVLILMMDLDDLA